MAVRYICGNLHPDHDTICDFRVRNEAAISEAFLQVLKLAKEMGVLKVGTVSVDGTKIKASASIHKSLRYDRAGQIEAQLELEIADLLAKAKEADDSAAEGNAELSQELQRLETMREKMRQAQEKLEKRAQDRSRKKKTGNPDDQDDPQDPPPPPPLPEAHEQVNLTDDQSRIMRKNNRSSYEQAYNAQAVVDAEGTMLVLGVRVSDEGPDAGQLALDIETVPQEMGPVVTVLADTGYANGTTVQKLQGQGIEVLGALGRQAENGLKRHDFRPVLPEVTTKTPAQKWKKPWAVAMKQALGFRQFLLRGLDKVILEWKLVACAYNLKRVAVLR